MLKVVVEFEKAPKRAMCLIQWVTRLNLPLALHWQHVGGNDGKTSHNFFWIFFFKGMDIKQATVFGCCSPLGDFQTIKTDEVESFRKELEGNRTFWEANQ